MADVKKINVNSTDYDIKDAKALRNKSTTAAGSFVDTKAGTTTYPTTGSNFTSTGSIVIGNASYISANTSLSGITIYGSEAHVNNSYATAVGYSSNAALQSAAFGAICLASASYTVAAGYNATATQQYAVAIGFASKASQGGATAVGAQASALAQYSTAVGRNATTYTSNSTYAVAVGFGAKAGTTAVALGGANTEATGTVSVALGGYAKATASYAVQIGQGTNNNYGTLQFRDWQLVKGDGKIPEERLPDGIKTATPQFPNLYDINEEKVSEQAILYTGTTNDMYKNSQFYRGRVRYGYPHFACGWVDNEWLDSQNDVMIDQQKLFTKLAEITKQRIDDDNTENGLIGGDNSEMSIYLKYDADNDYYFLDFDSDSFEKAFNGQSDDITGLSFEDLADYGIYFRNFHKPSDLEGEYEICDIYYYAPVYIDSYDWNNSPSYVDYFKFLEAMNDSDWGIGYVIPNYNYWEYEVDGTTYYCPIIPKTYEWNGDEYDNIEFRWKWTGEDWEQFINGKDIDRSWSTAEMYTTFGIKIDEGEEENVEYVGLTVRGGDQRYWEQFDPVNIENFATADQFEGLSNEVDALKNWSVQVVTGGKDLNNYTTEGVYEFIGLPITNKPSTIDTHFIMLVQVYSSYVKQIIFATKVNSVVEHTALTSYAPTIFHRLRNGGVWAPWQTVLSGDWSNYVTGFDRTKQQKLIHLDNSNGDSTSAVPRWVADTGGGSTDIDNLTITTNADDKIQAVATVNQNTATGATNPIYDWVGTFEEYQTQNIATLHPDWLCFIKNKPALNRYLVEAQYPTAENNYTWYFLYNDSWVEQGGFCNATQYNDTTVNVTFPIPMADTNYAAIANPNTPDHQATWAISARCAVKTTTNMCVHGSNNANSAYTGVCVWEVKGLAA